MGNPRRGPAESPPKGTLTEIPRNYTVLRVETELGIPFANDT